MTSANGTGPIASGHQKVCSRNPATTAQHRNWCVQSWEFGCPTRNGGNGQELKGHGLGKEARWRWRSWMGFSGWKARGMQDITFGLLGIKELLREQNGLLRRTAQGLDGGLGAGNEEVSTVRE